jgi:SAM-dependent methyltransferase
VNRRAPVKSSVLKCLRLSTYDLPTRDKIPVIQQLMKADGPGLALDIGVGTGYTTYSIFGERPTVSVDVDTANLKIYRDRLGSVSGARPPLCVAALATALPFKDGVFAFALCSEVMEHLEDDDKAAGELERVMAAGATAVITVPYTGLGFTGFLELFGVKTVHDFPGPEYHVRPGYDETSIASLLHRHGLSIERHAYYFRFFTRVATDFVSLAHICYQRLVHGRRAWTWSHVTAMEKSPVMQIYMRVFPVLWAVSRLDRMLRSRRGFGLVAAVRKAEAGPGSGRSTPA